jgi:hypothetical protein
MLLREVCGDDVTVATFDDEVREMPARRGFGLIDLLRCRNRSTDARRAVQWANAHFPQADRIIVITDEQSNSTIPAPAKGTRGYIMNVAAYQNGIGYGAWTHVSGFSENLVRFIAESEANA